MGLVSIDDRQLKNILDVMVSTNDTEHAKTLFGYGMAILVQHYKVQGDMPKAIFEYLIKSFENNDTSLVYKECDRVGGCLIKQGHWLKRCKCTEPPDSRLE